MDSLSLKAWEIVPPEFYIDDLMKYLVRSYYVGLLNAAALYGAAHQKPQVFSVITSLPALRDTTKKNTRIVFISTRKEIPQKWLKTFRGRNGDFYVSKPELTAVDLITFQKEIGGLNRACTVIYELMEVVKFGKLDKTFVTIQGGKFSKFGCLKPFSAAGMKKLTSEVRL